MEFNLRRLLNPRIKFESTVWKSTIWNNISVPMPLDLISASGALLTNSLIVDYIEKYQEHLGSFTSLDTRLQDCHVDSIRKTLCDWFKSNIQAVPLLPPNIVRRDPFAEEMLQVLTARLGTQVPIDSERFIILRQRPVSSTDESNTAAGETPRNLTTSPNPPSSPLALPPPQSENSLDLDDLGIRLRTVQDGERQRSDWVF